MESPGSLTFVKYDGGSIARETFDAVQMIKHVENLNERIAELQRLLDVTDADAQLIVDATLKMAEDKAD